MKKRVSFFTFGCRLNQAETSTIENSFRDRGYHVVDIDSPSDICVVNTCTVTKNGDADTKKMVKKIARRHPDSKIALLGCQAQAQGETLLSLPNVNWVIGNAHKMDLLEFIDQSNEKPSPIVNVDPIPKNDFTISTIGYDHSHTRANLKIQDGCDFYCLFCVIPYVRGSARSRQFDDLIREAKNFVAADFKEIVLTGVNIGCYSNEGKTFLDIINTMENIDGLSRLRISSIEPTTIPKDIISKMNANSILCRHLHIPLQSGCNTLLFKMNRKYTVNDYQNFLLEAYNNITDVCLGTDVIVGYPGENNSLFDETFDFLNSLPFAYFHVFSYSERELAKSKKLPNQVSVPNIQKRSSILRKLSLHKKHEFYSKLIDNVEPVLFEQLKNGYWQGLTDHYARVKVKSDLDLSNRLIPVKLETVDDDMITGKVV